MALINVPAINNLDAATPELWNTRYATIVNEINGNLDNANIKTSGITASNLATDSVTTGKIADANVTPVKWYNPYKFLAYAPSYTATTGVTKATLSSEAFDTNGNFDTATNYRYTVPVSGFYQISFAGRFFIVASTYGIADVYKNGVQLLQGSFGQNYTGVSSHVSSTGGGLVQLVAGDYLELWLECTQPTSYSLEGGSNPYYTYMSASLVSQT